MYHAPVLTCSLVDYVFDPVGSVDQSNNNGSKFLQRLSSKTSLLSCFNREPDDGDDDNPVQYVTTQSYNCPHQHYNKYSISYGPDTP